MGEFAGVLAAMLSSGLGGMAVGATRYLAGAIDPFALGVFRFGIGLALLVPMAFWRREKWPPRRDCPSIVALGLLLFGLFPVLFNSALVYTTAARGALALSVMPVMTMLIAAAFGVEHLTRRKSTGVLIAMGGVALALVAGLGSAPPNAWRGDLMMVAASLCMALYNVWARPLVSRSGPVAFTSVAMGAGACVLLAISVWRGSFAPVALFDTAQWISIAYLGVFGGAIGFYLWAYALERASPTRVAVSVTVNPVTAALVGTLLLHEPIGWNLIVGMLAVLAGIWIASRPER